MSDAALKEEVMHYLDLMDTSRINEVLFYAKKCAQRVKSPYGKYKTAEEYEEAKKLWAELEAIREDIATTCEPIQPDVDLVKESHEYRRRRYESLT